MEQSLFTDCKKPITANDFALIEQDLNIRIPDDLRSIYLSCNGGTPKNTIQVDESGQWDGLEIGRFLPILYDEENFGEKSFTVENVAITQWLNDSLPKKS